jgi:hypothetical protein
MKCGNAASTDDAATKHGFDLVVPHEGPTLIGGGWPIGGGSGGGSGGGIVVIGGTGRHCHPYFGSKLG